MLLGNAAGTVYVVAVVLPDTVHAGQLVALVSVGKADALVATINQYRSAPATADQLNVPEVETPTVPLLGAMSAGAGRSALAAEYVMVAALAPFAMTVMVWLAGVGE